MEIVKQILASDIIGWILAFLGGVIVFKLIDNMQTNIERHNVIKEVEDSINKIFSDHIAKSNKVSSKKTENNKANSNEAESIQVKNDKELELVTVRTILHDKENWNKYVQKNKDETEVIIEDGQRFVCIRNSKEYKEYISTQAIHELAIWFRRVEKLYKSGILKDIDLADMWREILPFGHHGRLEFYITYFNQKDAEAIAFVVFRTILACNRYKMKESIKTFCKYFKEVKEDKYKCDVDYISLFTNNGRYRLNEKMYKNHFMKLIEEYGKSEE